ncbi:MAG: hypothetical protein HYZ11_17265 [Candidatus Tectomicrobia bacterium]|uniref:Uncharacterized protein n=1 Tax=Tectimicrobiota bacterium TaxID=2528274 RepID=A0A932I418_UNCTE|nr:hypothetical protein [Candidatus Tectomicrobia bacterium]
MPVVLELPGQIPRRHLSDLPYDAPEFNTCSASAVSVGESAVVEAFVLPPRVPSAYAAGYEPFFPKHGREEEEISVTARAIPPKNLKAIELLEQWFSKPSRVPEEKWEKFRQVIAEGRSLSFRE